MTHAIQGTVDAELDDNIPWNDEGVLARGEIAFDGEAVSHDVEKRRKIGGLVLNPVDGPL